MTSWHKTGTHPFYIGMYIHIYTHIYVHKNTSQKECKHRVRLPPIKATDHVTLFFTSDIQQHRDKKKLQLLHLQGPNNKTHRSQALRPVHGLESTHRVSRESGGGFGACLKWSHQHRPIDAVVKYNRGLQLGLSLFPRSTEGPSTLGLRASDGLSQTVGPLGPLQLNG